MGRDMEWYGVGVTAGFNLLIGVSSYMMVFVNNADPSKKMICLARGERAGPAVHAGTALVVGKMAGVKPGQKLIDVKGAGLDFAIDVGARFADLIKGARYARAAANLIRHMDDFPLLVSTILQDSSKALINQMHGNLSTTDNQPSYAIVGIPGAGWGIGAGAWYERQRLISVTPSTLWSNTRTRWGLRRIVGRTILQVQGIPEPDGIGIVISDIHNVGATNPGQLVFAPANRITPEHLSGKATHGFWGTAHNFSLVEASGTQSPVLGKRDGLDLSAYRLIGVKTRSGVVPVPDQALKLRLSVLKQPKGQAGYRAAWKTQQAISVATDADGQIAAVHSTSSWHT